MSTSGTETVGSLGESALLARILRHTGSATAASVGPGDDAAVLRAGGDIVATVDTLVHGPDFRLAWHDGYALGWKSAAVNLADVAAMGARPTALLVALAVPADLPADYVEDLARGFRGACDALAPGCAVVGGDLTVSRTLTVAVTALGDLEGRAPVLRSGAQPGNVVAIAGVQGDAARGLRLLFERFATADGEAIPIDYDALSDAERALVMAQLMPEPPVALGVAAALAGAHAMMDVSDGLALDARRMAQASAVTIDLHRGRVGSADALNGGEDHGMLATFAPHAVPAAFRVIGEVRQQGESPLLVDGEPYEVRGGWDPYADAGVGLG